jgi:hypothetical protein
MPRAIVRRILRRMCGPVHEKRRWRHTWNSDIYSLYEDVNIADDIEIRRL